MTPQDIASRYQESFQFLQARKQRQVRQLVLLNNLQRGDQNISSTLLLTLFNRLVSSLYDDKLQVKFLPAQGITQEEIDSYNMLAQSDYLEMGKAQLDYDWCWDTLFFGRGYLETVKFDMKRKIMQPHVINPLVLGYDPFFDDPQDWRYYWKWITKSKWDIIKLIKNGTITGITKPEEIPSGVDPYLWQYKQQRDAAQKAVPPASDTQDGDIFQILEFYGYNDEGNKCVYWTDRDSSKIIYEKEIEHPEGEEETPWPIIVKEAFREPHSSVPFSVADLLEDKHRAKSVLLNLAFIAAKDRANPIYGYNPDKVQDVSQFFSRQIDQHIAMTDDTAAWPLNTQDPMSEGLIQFISILTTEANDPVGTGLTGQPQQSASQDTATQAAITQQMNDMAQSLQSKVMQFGEAKFWGQWFRQYGIHAADLGSKMANIVGVKNIDSQEIDLSHFVTNYPPGVLVYSAKEAEYKELVLRRDLMQLYPELQQTLTQDGMRNFNKYVFFPKFLHDPSLVDTIMPKTLDELKAEEENLQLDRDNHVAAQETDNHETHLYVHRGVIRKTMALWFHIAQHEEMLAKQQQQTMMQAMEQQQGNVQVGAEKQSPTAAATPLKTEINPQMSQA